MHESAALEHVHPSAWQYLDTVSNQVPLDGGDGDAFAVSTGYIEGLVRRIELHARKREIESLVVPRLDCRNVIAIAEGNAGDERLRSWKPAKLMPKDRAVGMSLRCLGTA